MQRHAVRSVLLMFIVVAVAAPGEREAPAPSGSGWVASASPGRLRLRHGNMIRCLGFLPDGKTLLSADWHATRV